MIYDHLVLFDFRTVSLFEYGDLVRGTPCVASFKMENSHFRLSLTACSVTSGLGELKEASMETVDIGW